MIYGALLLLILVFSQHLKLKSIANLISVSIDYF